MGDYLLTRVTAPTALPVSLDEVMRNLRVDGTDDADVLQRHLRAAVASVEEMTGRSLMPQTWRYATHGLNHRDPVWLPRPPVTELTAVAYSDAANDEQTLTVGSFVVGGDEDRIMVQPDMGESWPTTFRRPDAIRLTYSAGYADAASVPEEIRHAIIMLASHWYESRTAVSSGDKPIPFGVEHLVGLSRVGWVAS